MLTCICALSLSLSLSPTVYESNSSVCFYFVPYTNVCHVIKWKSKLQNDCQSKWNKLEFKMILCIQLSCNFVVFIINVVLIVFLFVFVFVIDISMLLLLVLFLFYLLFFRIWFFAFVFFFFFFLFSFYCWNWYCSAILYAIRFSSVHVHVRGELWRYWDV